MTFNVFAQIKSAVSGQAAPVIGRVIREQVLALFFVKNWPENGLKDLPDKQREREIIRMKADIESIFKRKLY